MDGRRNIKIIIIMLIVAMFISYHLYYVLQNKITNKNVDNYVQKEFYPQDLVEKNSLEERSNDDSYVGVLSIPKINFKKGFYEINNEKNNVNKNIEVLSISKMPNEKGTTLVIAAHSGDSYLGYFKDLYKLELQDEVYVYYQNVKYKYIINNIYELEKEGKINFVKNVNETYLVLTTCASYGKQLVVTAKLVN